MGIISTIFGKPDAKKADALASIADVQQALARLAKERDETRRMIDETLAKRRELLLIDGSDKEIKKLDDAVDAAHLALERLELAEPALHVRLREFQGAARRQRLAELEAKYADVVTVLDGAIAVASEAFTDYLDVVREFDDAGFSAEARGFVVAPPMLAGGVVAGQEPLERWRAERDRLLATQGRASAGLPLANPASSISPEQAAANIAARKPAPRPVVAPEYLPSPSRAPIKISEAPAYGFSKIAFIRGGVELDGKLTVAGDESIVTTGLANELMRSGAADLIEQGRADAAPAAE
ncbi:MAG TPA: hypothetical protein VIF34_14700 [Methylocystis sp.]